MRDLAREPMFVDKLPLKATHNGRARILRSGLVVSGFSTLETFLEDRIEEIVGRLRKATISYVNFEPPLRRLLTLSAVQGIVTKASFLEESYRLPFAEREIPRLAKFAKVPPTFTSLGFSSRGSNISKDHVAEFFKAFGVPNSWAALGQIPAHLGTARLSLSDDFENFARDRNRAAHDSEANIPSANLETHLETAILAAISVDVAATHVVDTYVTATTIAAAKAACVLFPAAFRFIDENVAAPKWTEKLASGIVAQHTTLQVAKSAAAKRTPSLPIVVRDGRLFPVEVV